MDPFFFIAKKKKELKMTVSRGFKYCYSSVVVIYLILCTINLNVEAYNVDHYSDKSCEKVKPFFDSLKLTSGHHHHATDRTGKFFFLF